MKVTNVEELEVLIQKVKAAQAEFATYTQEQVDRIFKQAALAANAARIPLAKAAVKESGMGVIEDKAIKNHFASEMIYNKYKNDKTCGIIESDRHFGYERIAEPVGLLAGIVPVTNPTSTTIFKSLIVLKTRNGIIFSPHPRAKSCTAAAAKIILDAAVAAEHHRILLGGLMSHCATFPSFDAAPPYQTNFGNWRAGNGKSCLLFRTSLPRCRRGKYSRHHR
jgi:acetaldehyde dehydrogenase/alcohol dehydrogenase